MLWSVFYLAQHHDHLHHFQQALSLIDQAIEHTMTLIELYIVKAKIYKVRLLGCWVVNKLGWLLE